MSKITPKKLYTAAVEARWPILLLKVTIIVLVVVFVSRAARDAWSQLSVEGVRINLPMAFASGAVFLIAQLPMAWFWRQSLLALGQPSGIWRATRAFYISQLGKYVPGKASVVLIRTERMLRYGGCGRTIAACVFYETLTHMAVGGLLAAGLLASGAGGESMEHRSWLILVSLGLAVACFVPTWPPVARGLLSRIAPSVDSQQSDAQDAVQTETALRRGLTVGLMAEGVIASSLAWCGSGASIWLATWSVGASDSLAATAPVVWVLAAALPVAAGFLSLLPAGVLVRDGLMLGLLAPSLGEANALATTLAVRLIWVTSEVLLCGILVLVWRFPARKT